MSDPPIQADAPHGPEFEAGCIALDENGSMIYRGLRLSRAYRDRLVVWIPTETPGVAGTPQTHAAEIEDGFDRIRHAIEQSAVFARLLAGHEFVLVLHDDETGTELAHREVGPVC